LGHLPLLIVASISAGIAGKRQPAFSLGVVEVAVRTLAAFYNAMALVFARRSYCLFSNPTQKRTLKETLI
jgi:hypothetical protein